MPYALPSLLAVLILLGGLMSTGVILLLAHVLMRPPRMTDGKAIYRLGRLSPGDLGMPFELQAARIRDRRTGRPVHLAGWWVPARQSSDRCAVLIHGYADAKVGAIAWAPVMYDLGFNLYVPDLRAHGESGGRYCTGGSIEADDVRQAIGDLRASRPAQTRRLMLFGVSMGAAVAAGVAADRDDVAAVVLESPFADYRRAVRAHLRLVGLPGGILATAALRWGEWLAGCRFDVRPPALIRRVRCPVLAIVGAADPLLTVEDVEAIRAAVTDQSAVCPVSRAWVVPDVGHLTAMHDHPAEYRDRVTAFVADAIGGQPTVESTLT